MGGGVKASPTALPLGKRPGTHSTGRCGGPRVDLNGGKKHRSHRDSIPGLDRTAGSESLYCLRYPTLYLMHDSYGRGINLHKAAASGFVPL